MLPTQVDYCVDVECLTNKTRYGKPTKRNVKMIRPPPLFKLNPPPDPNFFAKINSIGDFEFSILKQNIRKSLMACGSAPFSNYFSSKFETESRPVTSSNMITKYRPKSSKSPHDIFRHASTPATISIATTTLSNEAETSMNESFVFNLFLLSCVSFVVVLLMFVLFYFYLNR